MHILILQSGYYVTKQAPLNGIFQYHQARALRKKRINVGVLSTAFMPFRRLFFKYPYQSFEKEDGVNAYRFYKRIIIPGRIANKIFIESLVGLHLNLFRRKISLSRVCQILYMRIIVYILA